MKHLPISIIKAFILIIGVGVFAGLIWFPQTEGRAANLDQVAIYSDPLILYTYIGSISFFIGLYQIFKLLTLINTGKRSNGEFLRRLRALKYAAISLIGFIAVALVFVRFFVHGDDPAGPTGLGILVCVASAVVAGVASFFEKSSHNIV